MSLKSVAALAHLKEGTEGYRHAGYEMQCLGLIENHRQVEADHPREFIKKPEYRSQSRDCLAECLGVPAVRMTDKRRREKCV